MKELTSITKEHNRKPEVEPHKYSQLTVDKSEGNTNGTKIVFSTNGVGTTGCPYAQKKKKIQILSYTDLIPVTKSNSK